MIRDPSDGSVKGSPSVKVRKTDRLITDCESRAASGLPFSSTKPETIARLEKSREWLRNYRKTGLFHRTDPVASPLNGHPGTEQDWEKEGS